MQVTQPVFSDLFRTFFRIGCLSFGGPAGQIALMHREIVEERGWIDEEQYLHALNFCHLLPGPEAQQLATWIGWRLHGVRGGLTAGLLFVLPGALVMLALTMLYAFAARLDWFAALFLGIKAAVLAIVAAEALTWGTTALETLESFETPYIIAQSDAYYDVAGARTSLRGHRDALINTPTGRTVVRLRTGMPSPTAIAGLRADLTIDAFANVEGRAAQRIVGVWPNAGIALAVDGTESVVRAGARDLLRVLITQFRQHTSAAA